jgi:hypothetical protein
MSSLDESLERIAQVGGALAMVLVDCATGTAVRAAGEGYDLPSAAAGAADVLRASRDSLVPLGLDESLEAILVTTTNHYHLLRVVEQRGEDGALLFVDLDRTRANLALALRQVGQVAQNLLT